MHPRPAHAPHAQTRDPSRSYDGFEPLDPGRVNTMDPVEAEYWCQVLGCCEAELGVAVAEVGEHVTEVREWLARSR
jgi:hypothetical protein